MPFMSNLSDSEFDFLFSEIKDSIDGIGKAKASNIISLRDDFEEFSRIDREELEQKTSLKDRKIDAVLQKLDSIDFTEDIRILWTEKIILEFLETQYENLELIDLEKLDINVLMIKALGFTTVEEAIEFYVYQRVTRSVVTSWGSGALENLVKVSGAEEIPGDENVRVQGKAFDMRKKKGDKTYYIQLKSGPNTMNVSMVDSLNNMIDKIEDKHSDAVGMLGMTYGERDQVSSQIRGNLNDFDDKALIGEEFWEFLTDNENYYYSLISRIDEISRESTDKFSKSFLEAVDGKVEELCDEWEEEYGARGEEGMRKFLDTYTNGN
ncbi:MAG: hypothetical protein ACI8Z7_000973 [Candidatus Nanohaloarchaea archaeon]|jgi:hypothetical protein